MKLYPVVAPALASLPFLVGLTELWTEALLPRK